MNIPAELDRLRAALAPLPIPPCFRDSLTRLLDRVAWIDNCQAMTDRGQSLLAEIQAKRCKVLAEWAEELTARQKSQDEHEMILRGYKVQLDERAARLKQEVTSDRAI